MIIEHDSMPIVIAKDYKTIEQKLTVFARGVWDPKIIPLRQKYNKGHFSLKPPNNLAGHTELEQALQSAAWTACLENTPNNEFGQGNCGYYAWDGYKSPRRVTFADTKEASDVVKKAAKFFGASLVGITDFDPKWVYSSWYDFSTGKSIKPEFPFHIKSVVVIAIAMDYSAYLTSPSLISFAASGLAYSRMGEIGKKLADFIRGLGYNAIPAGNDTALSIPLAVQAGLGEVGRNGILITPQYGPSVRLMKVFTDIPLQADKPITFGVSQFCIKCRKCAQSCPANAIPLEPKPSMRGPTLSNCSGILKWYSDPEKCFKFWASNAGECGNCIACCPYNKWSSWHHGFSWEITEAIGRISLSEKKHSADEHISQHLNIKPKVLKIGSTAIDLDKSQLGTVASALCWASGMFNTRPISDNNNAESTYPELYKRGKQLNKRKTTFKNPDQASFIMKKISKFLGADLVGIAAYNQKWQFTEKDGTSSRKTDSQDLGFKPKSVIVLAIEMNYEACQSPTPLINTAAMRLGYSRMAETARKVVSFIKHLGYKAVACGDDTALSIPYAVMAGLGECGRNGLLITKEYGARVRLCKVFTDLELKTDNCLNIGVADFCKSCQICAESCPAEAIPFNDTDTAQCIDAKSTKIRKWSVNAQKCFQQWQKNLHDCCKCITACPFNRPPSIDNSFAGFIGGNSSFAGKDIRQISVRLGSSCDAKAIKTWWSQV